MRFKRYKLTIFFATVERPVEIEFYSFVSRVHKNVQRFVNRYNPEVVSYYTLRSL